MGNHWKLRISRRRLSTKKGWVKRRQQKILAQFEEKEERSTVEESIDLSQSVKSLPDTMDSENSTTTVNIMKGTYKNVDKCEDNNILVIKGATDTNCIEKSMHEGRRIETFCDTGDESIDVSELDQSVPDTMDLQNSTEQVQSSEPSTYKNVEECDYEPLIIEKAPLIENHIQESMPEGRRIVDISYIIREMHRTFDNHARGIECHFRDWKLINSCRVGLLTQLFFKCQMCNYEANIWSEPRQPDILDINTAAVAASITTGCGYAQFEEQCAAMNIPFMTEMTYIKYRENIVTDFENTAMENMKMAGEEEKQLALERNEVINGIPYITVVVDGSWSKRSYGKAYDSLSGVGAIIGYRTKKVLFVGIRNKYCAICDMADRQGCEPKTHKCYKNFDRNAASTSMESDAIAEGFKLSLPMHGLIYKTVIADGDSNVYHSIINNKPYQEQMITVKKIECTNHLLRNLCKKLKAVAETTQPKRMQGFIKIRNVLKTNILNIRREVIRLASLRQKENQPHHYKATELRKDILNIPSHIFGEHKQCKERGQKCENGGNNNYVPFLKLHGLYQRIESAIIYLSAYSDSLLLNLTNNPAESFNSIICKEIGGKRINFGKRGSYNARIAGSVLQYNTQQVLTQIYQGMSKTIPSVVEKLEEQRQIKVARTKESRQIDGKRKKFKRESGTDQYYGPQSQKPDVPPDVLEERRQCHMNKLIEHRNNCDQIERDTRTQSESELWLSLRREMLTASNFGIVCRMRPTTSCAITVKNILYPPPIDTAAMAYGRAQEGAAKTELAAKLNKNIKLCGLFIDDKYPYLGASPDGLIDDNGLVEIKCPLSAEHLTAEEAIKKLPALKGIFDKKDPNKLNQKHRFFYQIQGQLNITRREYCVFVIWTPKSMKIVHVDRDTAFWDKYMLPFLTRFYNECMLPEILDSRYTRHMPIRNPRYIVEAKEEAAKKAIDRKGNRQNVMKGDNIIDDENKTSDILPIVTLAIPENIDQDDCVIVDYIGKRDISEEDKARHKIILDDIVAEIPKVTENVLPINSQLNDESLDRLLRVIRETSVFETQSVQYIAFPHMIEPSHSDKSIQIIGGNCSGHWRCIFYNGNKLYVYDSLPGCTYEKLVDEEKNYIHLRYPNISQSDFIFEKVDTQPDSVSCGIYAAAFATTVALGGNPCDEKYSKRVKRMRQHFIKIIKENKLLPFPRR